MLETGSAVTMPWIDKVAGVVEAWFAGSAGHKALANVLAGDVNPSGKLAISFPKTEQDLPHPTIAAPPAQSHGAGANSATAGRITRSTTTRAAKVGYKWYEAEHKQPLFAFGFGLSYTSYAYSSLSVDSRARTVRFFVKNTGKRAGTEIAQVYARLPKGADESFKRLAGWKRVTLTPGQSQMVEVSIDPQVLQTFDEAKNGWTLAPGDYTVLVGGSSDSTPLSGSLRIQ